MTATCQGDAAQVRHGIMRLRPPAPSPDQAAQFMGLPSAEAGDSEIERAIRGGLALAEPLLQPVALWGLFDIAARHEDHLELTNPAGDSGALPCTGAFFRGAAHVQLTVMTLGPDFDALVQRLYGEDPLVAMAVDAAGAASLSIAGDLFQERRRAALAAAGLQAGVSFSPGCQGLPLTAQRAIFSLIHPERIGVTLSEACLMHPAKSVTSVTPVGPSLPGWMQRVTPCRICSLRKSCRFKHTRAGR